MGGRCSYRRQQRPLLRKQCTPWRGASRWGETNRCGDRQALHVLLHDDGHGYGRRILEELIELWRLLPLQCGANERILCNKRLWPNTEEPAEGEGDAARPRRFSSVLPIASASASGTSATSSAALGAATGDPPPTAASRSSTMKRTRFGHDKSALMVDEVFTRQVWYLKGLFHGGWPNGGLRVSARMAARVWYAS